MKKINRYLDGKIIVVTGGAGFLGSYVTEKLREYNPAEIIIPRSKDYDLRFTDAITQLLSDTNPHLIIHLAARVGGIGANQARPAEFFYDNLMMGTQLLHESWKFGVEKFVAVGTVCAYPKLAPVPFKEDFLWDGYPEETNAPYGLAKKMLLVQSQAYRQQYGFNSIYLLPVNLYGPKDNFDPESSHVIPALIKKFVEAQEKGKDQVEVWGTGKVTREFLYVKDAAEAIVKAAERYNKPEPINIGSSFEISIKDLAELIKKTTDFRGEIIWDHTKPDGQPRRKLDITRAKKEFGFKSQTPFAEGLKETIDWYLKHRNLINP